MAESVIENTNETHFTKDKSPYINVRGESTKASYLRKKKAFLGKRKYTGQSSKVQRTNCLSLSQEEEARALRGV